MDTRIGNAMKALHFERHRETNGKRRRGFRRLKLPAEEAVPPVAPEAPTNPPDEPIDDDAPF